MEYQSTNAAKRSNDIAVQIYIVIHDLWNGIARSKSKGLGEVVLQNNVGSLSRRGLDPSPSLTKILMSRALLIKLHKYHVVTFMPQFVNSNKRLLLLVVL